MVSLTILARNRRSLAERRPGPQTKNPFRACSLLRPRARWKTRVVAGDVPDLLLGEEGRRPCDEFGLVLSPEVGLTEKGALLFQKLIADDGVHQARWSGEGDRPGQLAAGGLLKRVGEEVRLPGLRFERRCGSSVPDIGNEGGRFFGAAPFARAGFSCSVSLLPGTSAHDR